MGLRLIKKNPTITFEFTQEEILKILWALSGTGKEGNEMLLVITKQLRERLLQGVVLLLLTSCGQATNYTITCDGPKYGQVAIMINDVCPLDYRKRF